MEDGFKEWNSVGVNAFRRRQSRYQSSSSNSRIPRGSSEAMATKLGPSFHTQPPTKYSFSNDTGKRSFAYFDIELLLCLGVKVRSLPQNFAQVRFLFLIRYHTIFGIISVH